MARKITLNVLFDKEQLEKIDFISKDLGISKGEFVRDAVKTWIHLYEFNQKQNDIPFEYSKKK